MLHGTQDAIAQSQRTEQLVLANPALADADKAAVIELLKSRVYTSHGARAEAGTARKVEVEQSTVLVADSKMYTHELLTLEERRFFLRGKIDRLEMVDGELVLVEIKNRMKRCTWNAECVVWSGKMCPLIFSPLRLLLQLQVVHGSARIREHPDPDLHADGTCCRPSALVPPSFLSTLLRPTVPSSLLSLRQIPGNVRRAKLIEQYMDDTHTLVRTTARVRGLLLLYSLPHVNAPLLYSSSPLVPRVACQVVERDDALWTGEVVPALHDFCARLHVAMGGPGAGAGPGPDDEQR